MNGMDKNNPRPRSGGEAASPLRELGLPWPWQDTGGRALLPFARSSAARRAATKPSFHPESLLEHMPCPGWALYSSPAAAAGHFSPAGREPLSRERGFQVLMPVISLLSHFEASLKKKMLA